MMWRPFGACCGSLSRNRAHFEVIGEAKNGAQAVKLAKELQPDLVLLDLSMPELDGLQALSPIQWECPNAKIVILSGFDKERVEPMVKSLGAHGCLEKGIKPADLVKELLAVLSRRGPGGGLGGKTPAQTEEANRGASRPSRKAYNRRDRLEPRPARKKERCIWAPEFDQVDPQISSSPKI
jgi:DNA-binding NarL/FixJ family response regulator